MRDYTKLLVWQKSRSLSVSVYEAARGISAIGAPGLRAQLIRATLSIGANIAEGAGRESRSDYSRFVTIASGSASEVVHHLTTASDLGLIDATVAARLLDQAVEIRKMLFGLRRALYEQIREEERERIN